MDNLKIQLIEKFGQDRIFDIKEIKVNVLSNKNVKVKNYSIEVVGNLCTFEMFAKPYILEYIYKAGIGSQKAPVLVCWICYRGDAMCEKVRLYLDDWLFNSGLVGFYNILKSLKTE